MIVKQKLVELLNNQKKFSENIQKKVGKDRAVTYAVYFLESNNIEATFQRICVTLAKLFPESFSFTEFPNIPDSRTVRNCIWHCVDNKKGWIVGRDKHYYNTTNRGLEIIQIFNKLIDSDMDVKSLPYSLQIKGEIKKAYDTKPKDYEINFLKEIKESKAFKLFKEDKNKIKNVDIKKSLSGDRYSPETYLYNQLTKAIKFCQLVNDKQVYSYLNWVKKNWNILMEE